MFQQSHQNSNERSANQSANNHNYEHDLLLKLTISELDIDYAWGQAPPANVARYQLITKGGKLVLPNLYRICMTIKVAVSPVWLRNTSGADGWVYLSNFS
jgi:hypothetical protein